VRCGWCRGTKLAYQLAKQKGTIELASEGHYQKGTIELAYHKGTIE